MDTLIIVLLAQLAALGAVVWITRMHTAAQTRLADQLLAIKSADPLRYAEAQRQIREEVEAWGTEPETAPPSAPKAAPTVTTQSGETFTFMGSDAANLDDLFPEERKQ